MKRIELATIASILAISALGLGAPLGCDDNDNGSDGETNAATSASGSDTDTDTDSASDTDTDSASDTDTDTDTDSASDTDSATDTDSACIEPPDFSYLDDCPECKGAMESCYLPPCDGDYDPDNCTANVSTWEECNCE